MRALLLVLVGLMLSTTADAKPRRKKRIATMVRSETNELLKQKPKQRGQSIGAPWSGSLRNATKFRDIDRAHVRRPQRAFATRTTIDFTRQAIKDVLADFPELHDYAIGDFSSARGGFISEHHSHQSGRDVDLGLFYKEQPDGYPENFVTADEKTLDARAMWRLISKLDKTRNEDGGVQVMFLDFELQGVIYKWARKAGVSDERLDRVFQFPHGRGSSSGLVRHEPNHGNHLHVRFKCADADVNCR